MLRSEILLHADVGQQEGWGHFRECLAVARALERRGIKAGFLIPSESQAAQGCVEQQGYPLYTLPALSWQNSKASQEILGLIDEKKPPFLIANLVEVSSEYAKVMSRATQGWAVITEHTDQEWAPVNFNISVNPELIPLDEAFCDSPVRVVREDVRELLICFGGTDPKNICGLVLEMLRQGFETGTLPNEIEVTAVLGPLFRHVAVVQTMKDTYPVKLDVIGPLDSKELAEVATRADLAITTGGDTMYEFCALGLPSIVVPVLEKMEANAKVLSEKGAVWQTARADRLTLQELNGALNRLLDSRYRHAMAGAAQNAVDGQGAERIVARLVEEWELE